MLRGDATPNTLEKMKKSGNPLASVGKLTAVLALFVAAATTGAAVTGASPLGSGIGEGAAGMALPFDGLADRSHQVVAGGGLVAEPARFFCFTGCLTQNDCSDGCLCVHPIGWPNEEPTSMPGVCL